MSRKRIAIGVVVVALGLVTATAASATRGSHAKAGVNTAVSGTVNFDGIWTAAEATAFGKVIAAFNKVYPNVHVKYKPVGNNLPTVL